MALQDRPETRRRHRDAHGGQLAVDRPVAPIGFKDRHLVARHDYLDRRVRVGAKGQPDQLGDAAEAGYPKRERRRRMLVASASWCQSPAHWRGWRFRYSHITSRCPVAADIGWMLRCTNWRSYADSATARGASRPREPRARSASRVAVSRTVLLLRTRCDGGLSETIPCDRRAVPRGVDSVTHPPGYTMRGTFRSARLPDSGRGVERSRNFAITTVWTLR